MRPAAAPAVCFSSRRRWLIWLAYAAAWTTALLVPVPTAPWTLGELHVDFKLVLAKSLHVLAYIIFTILAGWLRMASRLRWLPLFVVMAHGTVTELLQRLTETRSGLLTDVGLDHLGVALGLLVSWKWWTAPDAPAELTDQESAEEMTEVWKA
jgi:hypothetical protein